MDRHDVYRLLSDRMYLRLKFRKKLGKRLNLKNPCTFNEKLQWLKLYNRKPEYTMMVDKYKVRGYIAKKLGEEYLIPIIGVWDDPSDIDFDTLPNQFVLKCNHNSGLGMCICKDKAKLDINKVRADLQQGLDEDYYSIDREWPYKNVPRKIICEKYMVDSSTSELRDYKFFCFGGQCKCMKVDFDRFVEHHANYYDPEGNLLDLGERICPPDKSKNIILPHNIDKMIAFAEQLSKDIPFLRVDFYDVDGAIYFGELTFFPASGFGAFIDENWDYELGKWIKLPNSVEGGYILLTHEFIILLKNPSRELKDYKLFCFNGQPKLTLVCSNRFGEDGLHEDFFDNEWNHLPLKRPDHDNSDEIIEKPVNFDKMLSLAKKLSANIPFVRIDFYEIDRKVYFGEITFFPASGFSGFEPEEWDRKLGKWIDLPGYNG